MKLNKQEQKFLFEELVPIQFKELKETEEKKRLKFFLEAHKIIYTLFYQTYLNSMLVLYSQNAIL